ncbi:MAG TPA: hypothetical protein VES96_03690 [Nitrospiraceae bacterium]|nr:hypothetical protein [Nitrospiraceae bacterium]
MSWLTKRVQTTRLRGKNKKTQTKGILRRLPANAGGHGTPRFLSGAINVKTELEAQIQYQKEQGGRL